MQFDFSPLLLKHRPEKHIHYFRVYQQYFETYRSAPLRVLELGVNRGGSLEVWAEYFPKARIVGVDNRPRQTGTPDGKNPPGFSTDRIRFAPGSQDDAVFLNSLSNEEAPQGWDIIIDDCSHVGELSLASFLILFPRLKKHGFYAVEDWGTGYWPNWPAGHAFDLSRHFTAEDGRLPNHPHSMAGFLKQCVDEMAMGDIKAVGGADRVSQFEWVHFHPSVVVIKKMAELGAPLIKAPKTPS
jgi:hypothetical protein